MGFFDYYPLICLIYLVPGSIFYIAFLIHLFKSAETKTPFFSIIKIMGFVDLSEIVFSSINMRMGPILAQIPFFQPPGSNNFLLAVSIYGMVVLHETQAWLHAVLGFNRLTAILLPTHYKMIWRGKYFFGIVSVAFFVPGIIFSWVLYFGASILYVQGLYGVDGLSTGIPWLRKSTFTLANVGITGVLAAVFDVLTFVLLRNGNLIEANKTKYKQEFRLLTVSFVFLLAHIMFLFQGVMSYFIKFTDPGILGVFLQSAIDLQSLISPFCVLLLNKNLRHSFFNISKSSAVSVVVSTAHQSSQSPTRHK